MISLLPVAKSWFEPGNTAVFQQHEVKPLLQSLLVMAWLVEARDPYTGGHLWRVSQYCRVLAEALGLSNYEVARITLGGFLHDLGKISVPDEILKKPGRLNDEEYETIMNHPEMGARVLIGHPLARLVKSAILHHHERPDGAGYPFGLDEGNLPIDSRIVSICDAFDAMTSARPYRSTLSVKQALKNIRMNLHTQFDGNFGHIFIELGNSGRLNTILGHTDQGIPIQTCLRCGPTIVVRRNQKSGEYAYCPNCAAEAVIEKRTTGLAIHHTGRKGSKKSLQPKVDMDLIGEFIATSASVIMLPQV
ncbi:MAG: HD-GYP domain-containing protein [Candidatus Thiodiazotropha sp.]